MVSSYLMKHSVCQHPLPYCWTSSHFFGVPQGSPLGPYSLFTTQLIFPMSLKSTLSFTIHMPVMLNSRSLISDLLLSMQKCIDYIKTWMTVNKLKLNDDKTKEMITSSGRKSRSLSSSFPDSMSIRSASVSMPDPVNAVPFLALVTMFD